MMSTVAHRVFLLEDDPVSTRIVKTALEGDGYAFGMNATVAGTLDRAASFQPDLFLLDILLPDGNGYDVCRQLRETPQFSEVPVIFLTTRGDVESRLRGFEVGGSDYISKPFSPEEMLSRIRVHLGVKIKRDRLDRIVDAVSLRDRMRDDMIDMLVHDLRTPLSSIRMTLELLRSSDLLKGTEFDPLLASSQETAGFALLMLNDHLDLSSGRLQVKANAFDWTALCQRLGRMMQMRLKRREMSLELDLPNSPTQAVSDDVLILRILINLLTNSVKFSPKGSVLGLTLRSSSSGGWRLEVLDRGPGIPDADKEKVFGKFYRTAAAQREGISGFGVGLAFCRMAATALGGSLRVEDRDGGGSRFGLDLPPTPPLQTN